MLQPSSQSPALQGLHLSSDAVPLSQAKCFWRSAMPSNPSTLNYRSSSFAAFSMIQFTQRPVSSRALFQFLIISAEDSSPWHCSLVPKSAFFS